MNSKFSYNISELSLLKAISITCTVISPVVSSKVIELPFHLFGLPATISGSAPIYVLVFLISNILVEQYGEQDAKETASNGVICALLSSLIIFIIRILPSYDASVQNAYNTILGSNVGFALSGILALMISQFVDIETYSWLRTHVSSVKLCNIISLLASQAVDTIMFLGLSYGLVLGWIHNSNLITQLVVMMLVQYVVRIVIILVETLLMKVSK